MGTKTVFFAALAALPLAVAPAWAESEGNGPAGNDGVFGVWVVPVGAVSAATNANADGYPASPAFGVTMSGQAPTYGGEGASNTWPARALGGSGVGMTQARTSGPGARRG